MAFFVVIPPEQPSLFEDTMTGIDKRSLSTIRDLRAENARLRAALLIAREWMPVKPYGFSAKEEVDIVEAALGYPQKSEVG